MRRKPGSYDFGGWATKNNILCSDGRTIRPNAFKGNDGTTVPLVWNHQHNDAYNVMGHADLENRAEGVYAYCTFNNTDAGQIGKELVQSGDVTALSIYANQLKQLGGDVVHGAIREVSLVLGGANPQALIDTVISHSDGFDEEAIITFIDDGISLSHSDDVEEADEVEDEIEEETESEDDEELDEMKNLKHSDIEHADKSDGVEASTKSDETETKGEESIGDVIDSMTKKQRDLLYALVAAAANGELGELEDEDDEDGTASQSGIYEGEDDVMKHNVFEGDVETENVLSHSEMQAIMEDARKGGLLSDAIVAHGIDIDSIQYIAHADKPTYGISNIDMLFPEYKSLNTPPEFLKRDTGWVSIVMNGVHKTPFSRIKSMFADLREDEARALGYMKGKLKKEEVFTLLKRTTDPQTIYKKQKLDRDDVIDIVDFDIVAWIKGEMRMMLEEEIARAILVGDGRLSSSDDKIQESHIRPIWKDEELYNIKVMLDAAAVSDPDARAKNFIRKAVKGRVNYKGSGNPTLFTTEDLLSDLLLLEDKNGKRLYNSENELASAMRVSRIQTVPVMENVKDTDGNTLMGIIVNLNDYNVGADRGGSVSMFEDFDIDYNQQKYLIETRCSGALIKPFSAITILAPAATGANVVG